MDTEHTSIKVAVVGGGHMGGALLRGWAPQFNAWVVDRNPRKVQALTALGVSSAPNVAALHEMDAVVVAVKPHGVAHVVGEVARVVSPDSLIISVAAGVPLKVLEAAAPGHPIARTMPNTGAALGRSTTTAHLGAACDKSNHTRVLKKLFDAVGQTVFLPSEEDFHAAIALAGSGPAFVLDLMDAMMAAGVDLGLPRPVAHQLAVGAFDAAAALVAGSGDTPANLRNAICSPGGTTIAGVYALEQAGGKAALWNACRAAAEKSRAMEAAAE